MQMSSIDCEGHQLHANLSDKIRKAKDQIPTPIDETKTIHIKKGGQHGSQIAMKDLNMIVKGTEEWKEIEKGRGLVVPNVEPRLKSLRKPDSVGKRGFVKETNRKKTDIGHYTADCTDQWLENFVKEHFDQCKLNGKTDDEAKNEIFKLPEYLALKSWLDQKAEVKVKEAVEKEARRQKLKFAIFRSLQKEQIVNEKQAPRLGNHTALKEIGLNIPDKSSETDILFAYADGDHVHIVLIEVKRQDTPPWNPEGLAPSKSNVRKAVSQLEDGFSFFRSLFSDLPQDSIIFHTLSAFPDAPLKQLEKVVCSSCLNKVVGMEDLEDWTLLSQKLGVVTQQLMSATRKGMELLLTVVARLSGPHSLLHAGCRTLEDKMEVEAEKVEANITLVDQKISQRQYVVASKEQQEAIAEFSHSPNMRHAILQGPPGSGKTTVLTALGKAITMGSKEKVFLIVLCTGSPLPVPILQSHLSSMTDSLRVDMRVIFPSIVALMNHFQLDPGLFKMDGHAGVKDVYNNPKVLKSVVQRASCQFPNHRVILAADELIGWLASDENDWRELDTDIPEMASLLLVLNPGTTHKPLLLPTNSFLHIESELRYRSTRSIIELYNCVAENLTSEKPVTAQGNIATDIKGDLPTVIDLGHCSSQERLMNSILAAKDVLGQRAVVTFEGSQYLSPQTIKTIEDTIRLWPGWEMVEGSQVTGSEWEMVLVVGRGVLECISRARIKLVVITMWEDEAKRHMYNRFKPGYAEAERKGLIQSITLNK